MKKGAFIVMLLALCSGADAEILFQEDFEDTNFASRGWYDHLRGTVTTAEHVKGSTAAFECTYLQGQTSCEHGAPGRRLFEASDTVYLSYWVKYSSNFIGSGKAYHPHEFHFLTNKDGIYVGPANSHLSTYTEQVGGRPMLAIQDSRNVNTGCIVHQNDPVGKCDGYAYGEQRSVASCNGIVGYLDSRTCYYGGYWYSARAWYADDVYFKDTPGPYYKNDWHYVEAMFQMNSIADGKGIPDARIRYWYDGELLISSDNILLRTGANADMQFNQFFTGFYIGDGSPRTQTMWVDNLTLSTQRIPYPYSGTVCGDGVCNSTETCETCPEDCGPCCGDGTCAHYENCST